MCFPTTPSTNRKFIFIKISLFTKGIFHIYIFILIVCHLIVSCHMV